MNGATWLPPADQANPVTLPPSALFRGDAWTVQVQAVSEHGTSEVAEAHTVIGNAPPIPLDVTVLPEVPRPLDPLTVDFSCIDPDGDPTTAATAWFRDTVRVTELEGASVVPSAFTEAGQAWRVEVVCHDGTDPSEDLPTATVVILP